jgi:hypothetical protein
MGATMLMVIADGAGRCRALDCAFGALALRPMCMDITPHLQRGRFNRGEGGATALRRASNR